MGTYDRRRRERDERRQRILHAAESVFLEKGYQDATMDDVAREAELGKGTLYLYFKNKDDLFLAVTNTYRYRLIDRFDDVIPEATNGFDLLSKLMSTYCDTTEEEKELWKMLLRVSSSDFAMDPGTEAFRRWKETGEWTLRIVVNAIVAGQRDGSIRPDVDASMAGLFLLGGGMGVWLVRFGSEKFQEEYSAGVVPESFPRAYFAFLIDALRARPTGSGQEVDRP